MSFRLVGGLSEYSHVIASNTVLGYAYVERGNCLVIARGYAILDSGSIVALVIYIGAWLSIADDGTMLNGNNNVLHIERFAGHRSHGEWCEKLFEPAYRVDHWLRPTYWSHDEQMDMSLLPE